ncbi:MAG: hypothetical protein SCABRO_02549 [Candidatus Scalindua brodae]|uniref:Uncharacterized protein n=1 Tax=Candidatus Scalindua brodae TaxID=237368 RepID=A0A0B0EI66_9BACT|nr:MAG: hypothetical protein SCABRO_02549 [Candidatus Scalindua brodae]
MSGKLKSNLITILTIGMIVSGGFFYNTANNLNAEEKKNPTIYICYCAGGCLCAYETLESGGRCVCGLATIPSDREKMSDEYEYECNCGTMCECGTRADEPGLCHCGILEMKEVE